MVKLDARIAVNNHKLEKTDYKDQINISAEKELVQNRKTKLEIIKAKIEAGTYKVDLDKTTEVVFNALI